MGSFKSTKLWKSTVSLNGNSEIMLSRKETMRSSCSCQDLRVERSRIIKEVGAILQLDEKSTNKFCELERRTSIASTGGKMLSESKIFMIKTIIVLSIICLPGNIFALSILYKHSQIRNTSMHSYGNQSHLSIEYHTGNDTIEFDNISYTSNLTFEDRSSTTKVRKKLNIVIM